MCIHLKVVKWAICACTIQKIYQCPRCVSLTDNDVKNALMVSQNGTVYFTSTKKTYNQLYGIGTKVDIQVLTTSRNSLNNICMVNVPVHHFFKNQ